MSQVWRKCVRRQKENRAVTVWGPLASVLKRNMFFRDLRRIAANFVACYLRARAHPLAPGDMTMLEYLPEGMREALALARKKDMHKGRKLCVHDGDRVYRIRRLWDNGFSLERDTAARLRGRVEIFDGPRHLYQCLVIDSAVKGEERVFDFKWVSSIPDRPPADFVREEFAPMGLLAK